jgi:hypothetical protein
MHLFVKLLICGYVTTKPTISVFKPTIQPFFINGIRYRESINPVFALESYNKLYSMTEDPVNQYMGYINYGKNQLHDKIINNEWTKIDNTYVNTYESTLVYILATTKMIYSNYVDYKIMDNENILWKSNHINLNHFHSYIINPGFHNISFWVRSPTPTCLCPSNKKGFSMSYQLAVWKDEEEKQLEVYNSSKNIYIEQEIYITDETNDIESNSYYINTENITNMLVDSKYNDLVNSLHYGGFISQISL